MDIYERIKHRWTTHDAIYKDDYALCIVWFNPDSDAPSWEWANVEPDTVLELKEEYGEITEENARDFCVEVSSRSPQCWEIFKPDDPRDISHTYDKADYIGAWDLDEAKYLINWAKEVEQ